MKKVRYLAIFSFLLFSCVPAKRPAAYRFQGGAAASTTSGGAKVLPVSYGSGSGNSGVVGTMPSSHMLSVINVQPGFIKLGTYGRATVRRMTPRYITIHSTQNYTGDAWDHVRALQKGKLRATKRVGGNRIGFLTWHFTVQQDVAVQHLPTNEQGEHADFDGPGNNYSIGIEMCEHAGNSQSATVDRTARLVAYLLHEWGIPVSNVVPHYHWPRKGANPAHKNCPIFLLDNGRPGAKWSGFLARVNYYFRQMAPGSVSRRL